jgi:pyrophosphatase PpaX
MLVLFDLDGTIIDSTDLILATCEHTFDRHLRGGCPSRADLIATFGRSLPAVLRELAVAEGFADPDASADAMLSTYRDYQRQHHDVLMKPFAGVPEMLEVIKSQGHRLGLVTSKMQRTARRGLRLFDLEQFFDVAVFHDDTSRHKPAPDPLVAAAARAGADAGQTIYVGDSVHDIVAGRAAGMRTIAALWGPFDRAVLESQNPDALAERPEQVPALLH